jgi:hypothetical protein
LGRRKLYKHWLYTRELNYAELGYDDRIPYFANPAHCEEDRVPIQSSILADNLVHLWALGELLGDHELKETTITELDRWYVNARIPSVISDQTVAFADMITEAKPTSPLRLFCFRWAMCRYDLFSQVAEMWLSDVLLLLSQEEERRDDARAKELEVAKRLQVAKELELAEKLKLVKGFELEKRRKEEVAEARRLRRAQNAPQRKERRMANKRRRRAEKAAAAGRQ